MSWVPIQEVFPIININRNFTSSVEIVGSVSLSGSIITATGVRSTVGSGDSAGVLYFDLPQKQAIRVTYLSYSASLDGSSPVDYQPARSRIIIGGDMPGGGFLTEIRENAAPVTSGSVSGWQITGGQPFVLTGVAQVGTLPDNDYTRFTHFGAYIGGESFESDTLAESFSLLIEVWNGPFVEAPIDQQVFVYTMNRTGQVGAWSRYVFPFNIDATAQLGENLYLRSGDVIYRVDEDADSDAGTPIVGVVQWPWLDFGSPGATKMLQSVDVVGSGPGTMSLQIGYDQRSVEAFTPSYTIPIDTMTGMPVPMPVSAPTFSVRLTFTGKWNLQAVNVYLADNRRTT